MSITNYAELQTAVANYLHRSDLTSVIPDFITLAETKLNRMLRLRAMQDQATGTVASSVALPTGFLEVIALTVTSGGTSWPLLYVPPTKLSGESSTSFRYSIIGDNIYFDPAGTETYTLTYFKKFAALSAGTNWLIETAPDLYLYATLMEASPYIKDTKSLQIWGAAMTQLIEDLQRADRNEVYGTNLQMRAA
jgi:hypothetical protein